MNSFTFDEAKHEYRVDGIVYPSVTQILAATGITNDFQRVPDDVLEKARDFGSAVHFACELDDTVDIKKYHIDESIMVCLRQWRKIKKNILNLISDKSPEKFFIEKPFYAALGFAGRPDRVYTWIIPGLLVIVDLKTGADSQGANIQTAAYAQLLKEYLLCDSIKIKKVRRFAAHLDFDKKEGRLEEFKNKTDWNIFLSALNLYKYRQSKGLL